MPTEPLKELLPTLNMPGLNGHFQFLITAITQLQQNK